MVPPFFSLQYSEKYKEKIISVFFLIIDIATEKKPKLNFRLHEIQKFAEENSEKYSRKFSFAKQITFSNYGCQSDLLLRRTCNQKRSCVRVLSSSLPRRDVHNQDQEENVVLLLQPDRPLRPHRLHGCARIYLAT